MAHTHTQVYRHTHSHTRRNEELERSIRSTNYCHSLLRAERGSTGWNSGLREGSCWSNDNNSWINNQFFSPSFCLPLPPPSLSWSIWPKPRKPSPSFAVASLFSLPSFLLLWPEEEAGAGIVPTPPFLLSHLFQFVMLWSPPSVHEGWRAGWRGVREKGGEMGQRNWYLHSSHNETFRCGRSYASTLMACDEGERGKGGKEGGEG